MIKNRSWLYISILTLVVALAWVGVSAISHFRKSTVPTDIEKATAPLDPNLDANFFLKLSQKSR